jgi:dihydrofolate synthase/folylpolyglutamate synthase
MAAHPSNPETTALAAAREAALQFLYSRVDYERVQSVPYHTHEFRLDRMRQLLARLGNPQSTFAVVHVAGTKGKGSTSATLGAILSAAGYHAGVFTSPHLEQIEERLAIDGKICTPEEFVDLVRQVRPIVEAMDRGHPEGAETVEHPTFFEIITAMAFLYFAAHHIDVAVLEVGLGGRLDSTNVCRPSVAVITSISFDHMRQLGNTLEAIATEKAGIVKPGVPVISGVTDDGPREVIRTACHQQHCPLAELGVDFHFDYAPPARLEQEPAMARLTFADATGKAVYDNLDLALPGRHQAANAAVALAAIDRLVRDGWTIPESAVRAALTRLVWPARVEVVGRRPAIIIDAAHNVASVHALLETLDESFSVRHRRLVFATTREKDTTGMLRLLLDGFDDIVFTRYTNNPRAVPPEELAAAARNITGREYPVYQDPHQAWEAVRGRASADDLVCVTGSFFIAAQIRKLAVADC